MPGFNWTPEVIEKLKTLWIEEKRTAGQIGDRLGISRSAVLGKVHRLNLPGRPNPVPKVKAQRGPRRAPKGTRRATLPSLSSTPTPTPVARPPLPFAIARGADHEPQEVRQASHAPPSATFVPRRQDGSACQWIVGNNGMRRFYCDADLSPYDRNQSYCQHHLEIAYPVMKMKCQA